MNPIAERRKQMGLTQAQISQETGIPLRTYARIENAMKGDVNGIDGVSAGNLKKIAYFFGCSVDDLLNPSPAPVQPGEKESKTA